MAARCDPFLYIWYFNFDAPGSLNDINVLDRSNIAGLLTTGDFNNQMPLSSINGRRRDWLYFLVDGIYPCWSVFVKTNHLPTTQRETKYSKQQKHVQEDVECSFGVLVKRFRI